MWCSAISAAAVLVLFEAAGCALSHQRAGPDDAPLPVGDGGDAPFDAGGPGRDAGGPVRDGGGFDGTVEHPFAGFYVGTYAGEDSGDLEVLIRADGTVTVTTRSRGGMQMFEGTIDVDGMLHARGHLGGTVEVDYAGTFRHTRSGHVGSGTWAASSGLSGTWRVRQVVSG